MCSLIVLLPPIPHTKPVTFCTLQCSISYHKLSRKKSLLYQNPHTSLANSVKEDTKSSCQYLYSNSNWNLLYFIIVNDIKVCLGYAGFIFTMQNWNIHIQVHSTKIPYIQVAMQKIQLSINFHNSSNFALMSPWPVLSSLKSFFSPLSLSLTKACHSLFKWSP